MPAREGASAVAPYSARRSPVQVGVPHRRGPVADAELPVDPRQVGADRLLADHESPGDRRVAQPLGQQPQHLVLAARQRRRRARGARPPEQRVDAREQLVGLERLDHVVVPAEQQPGRAVERLRAFARDEHDRQASRPFTTPQPPDDLVPREVRHHDVEHEQVRRLPARRLEGGDASLCLDGAIAARPQHLDEERPRSGIVVGDDDQAAVHGVPCIGPPPGAAPRSSRRRPPDQAPSLGNPPSSGPGVRPLCRPRRRL